MAHNAAAKAQVRSMWLEEFVEFRMMFVSVVYGEPRSCFDHGRGRRKSGPLKITSIARSDHGVFTPRRKPPGPISYGLDPMSGGRAGT